MTSSSVGNKNTQNSYGEKTIGLFPNHLDYAGAVGEIHSRPVSSVSKNSVILHFAFISDGGPSVPYTLLKNLCERRGEPFPNEDVNYFELRYGSGTLRWERHSEFSTFTYDGKNPKEFLGDVEGHPFGNNFNAPGSLISACRIEVRPFNKANAGLLDKLEQNSLCVSQLGIGKGLVATDFHQDKNGMTVFLLLEDKMTETRIGYFVKSVLEMETYRTLATLGLPLARKLSKKIGLFELELSKLTGAIKNADAEQNETLLNEINNLAADLEADAASSLFRFGATRAYGNIALTRAAALGGERNDAHVDISSYLQRSLKPAMSTCQSVEYRQENMSQKLARAANLLRTRVEIAIENQNRNLLSSMNRRTQMQFRLQQTVEGLSVAAVSYYIVGLVYYVTVAMLEYLNSSISAKLITGCSVPIVIMMVWLLVRNLRKRHSEKE